ncbi:ABC transporter ATP-binding protein [Tabrizicola sp. YIM 78059]|uniref:ABC transporter ATP-binding protein n=1 Tax=Tabrizicola sp. YIM 78059 TaxID=2529861 RepID=UPI0010AB1954|nr:ABC transporter ATP-binding protein [Tabrizicola sp. YIM 78059]
MTLELHLLTKTYPGAVRPTVRDLSLTVPRGGVTALLGPSGAGKTTVMRMVAGLLAPDTGDIRLDDRSLLPLPPERRGVVMVFQNAPLFPHLTLAENVGFGLRMRGLPSAEIHDRVGAMLERVQLSGLGSRRPHQLSGGQQQRGALARALVLRPRLLLLDEPLSNLDAALREEMRGLIRALQRETGITTLVVTHDQSEAVVLADRVALLLDGRLAQEAEPDEIFARPASVAVARFIGGVNFLPGRCVQGAFECALGRLPLPSDASEGPGTLTIRPEALRLGPGPDARVGQVLERTFLGSQTRLTMVLAGQRLEALVAPDTARHFAPGDPIQVSLPVDALWVIPDAAG